MRLKLETLPGGFPAKSEETLPRLAGSPVKPAGTIVDPVMAL